MSSAGIHPPKKSKRPKESRILQQDLPACKPLLTPKWVIAISMLLGVIFIPIGVISLMASRTVVEIVHRYDDTCLPVNLASKSEKVQFIQNAAENLCTATITVPKRMKRPIYVYYELENFYQNHRRYVKSRSDSQLLNGESATDTSNCKPEQYLLNNVSLPIIPCGLIAWSLFNDTYAFTTNSTTEISINKTGIAWKSDRTNKFGSDVYPKNFPNNGNLSGVLIGGASLDPNKSLSEDEDLIVWMRPAALPHFRKLYGRIEQNLDANTVLNVTINNVYNTYSFDGKKRLVLSTTSWLGGKNDFLGILYITVGAVSIFYAFVFFVGHLSHPRDLGDTQYLSWNRRG